MAPTLDSQINETEVSVDLLTWRKKIISFFFTKPSRWRKECLSMSSRALLISTQDHEILEEKYKGGNHPIVEDIEILGL